MKLRDRLNIHKIRERKLQQIQDKHYHILKDIADRIEKEVINGNSRILFVTVALNEYEIERMENDFKFYFGDDYTVSFHKNVCVDERKTTSFFNNYIFDVTIKVDLRKL